MKVNIISPAIQRVWEVFFVSSEQNKIDVRNELFQEPTNTEGQGKELLPTISKALE